MRVGWGYHSDGPAGLQLLGLRYYDPVVGRFLSPDPISYLGGLNIYAYAGNDPVNSVDPLGLSDGDPSDLGSDDDITHFGKRFTQRLIAAPFHTGDMAFANRLHRQTTGSGFRSGNRPLGQDLLNIHSFFGQVGGGGPILACKSVTQGAAALGGGGGRGKGFWHWLRNLPGQLGRRKCFPAGTRVPVGVAEAPAEEVTVGDRILLPEEAPEARTSHPERTTPSAAEQEPVGNRGCTPGG